MTHPHTTSLEVSKKLADACKKMQVEMPGSYFISDGQGNFHENDGGWDMELCSARFTLGELMRMLPDTLMLVSMYEQDEERYFLSLLPRTNTWVARYTFYFYEPMDYVEKEADTPENAACELLTELILSGKVTELRV